ncbi:twin-arginine translocation signal domain-containing protein, partial [Klebsiella pneumoniae]|uniref:twin-arginine translocation signal domain-containing protein n=1 Tax=Klebsiella pneumoniae TaxID=573 RepID=UPI002236FC84
MSRNIDRRQVLRGAALVGGGMAVSAYRPAGAQPVSGGIVKPLPTVSGTDIALTVDGFKLPVDGKSTPAIGVNG